MDLLLKQVYGPRADTLDPRQLSLFESPSTEITPTAPSPMEPEALRQCLKEQVLSVSIVNTDDTPVPVQDPDREHCRTGRIWAYVSEHGTVYDATEDRSRDGPLAFLKDFRGYLQCDAYAGYDELFRRSNGTIVEVGCWAHARRKFVEAQKTSLREAHEVVARVKQLYSVENEANGFDAAARMSLRQEKSVPLLSTLKERLNELALTALPKSPLGEAVTYACNRGPR